MLTTNILFDRNKENWIRIIHYKRIDGRGIHAKLFVVDPFSCSWGLSFFSCSTFRLKIWMVPLLSMLSLRSKPFHLTIQLCSITSFYHDKWKFTIAVKTDNCSIVIKSFWFQVGPYRISTFLLPQRTDKNKKMWYYSK